MGEGGGTVLVDGAVAAARIRSACGGGGYAVDDMDDVDDMDTGKESSFVPAGTILPSGRNPSDESPGYNLSPWRAAECGGRIGETVTATDEHR
jgi:hypothetical protein